MAAKTIVTFHPDVACDMCGRRLLRGERPDVFMGGGQRRMVCELCTPRATHEGWRREVDGETASSRSQRQPRGRSLLGRLRQLREPVGAPEHGSSDAGEAVLEQQARGGAPAEAEWTGIEREWSAVDDEWTGPGATRGAGREPVDAADSYPARGGRAETVGDYQAQSNEALGYARGTGSLAAEPGSFEVGPPDAARATAGASSEVRRALEVFNAGATPRRVAGVTRALGPACVRATSVPGASGVVAIVVAWELCWYRYEIDLSDEAAGASVAAEGMELEELAPVDRVANAAADEHGMLSLLTS